MGWGGTLTRGRGVNGGKGETIAEAGKGEESEGMVPAKILCGPPKSAGDARPPPYLPTQGAFGFQWGAVVVRGGRGYRAEGGGGCEGTGDGGGELT